MRKKEIQKLRRKNAMEELEEANEEDKQCEDEMGLE